MVFETYYNPNYKCPDCGKLWTSRPLTLVNRPDLVLPPCPKCGTSLTLASILASLMEEPAYDASIADQIRQDTGKAYRDAFREELKDWDLGDRTLSPS